MNVRLRRLGVSALEGKKPKKLIEDTRSGSLAYNRLDMQVSQALHMAVEMFQNLDYLLVLDHYDDITVFDNENSPAVVSYYQMKSHEESITINTVIREKWLPKLYQHLENGTWNVNELGLITPCILKISASQKDNIKEQLLTSEKTPFSNMDCVTQLKIKENISQALSIPVDEVDLSKFVHMRTTLTIAKHHDMAEQSLNTLLRKKYHNITLEKAKTIFNTLVELLSQRQSYEHLDNTSDFEMVRKYKGVSKNDVTRVIDDAMMVCIPTYDEIIQWAGYQESELKELSYAYFQVMTDEQKKLGIQRNLFQKVAEQIYICPKNELESMIEYAKRIKNNLLFLPPIYSDLYILVVVTSILINDWRRGNE